MPGSTGSGTGRFVEDASGRAFEIVSDLRHAVGECPVWDEVHGRILWASIRDCEIHALTPRTGEKQVWRFPSNVGSFGLCRSGRLVVALKSEVILFDPVAGTSTLLAAIAHAIPEAVRFNDGKVGPDGAFWVGSMDDRQDKQPIGRLYRVDPDGGVDMIADGIRIANGLAWNVAETRMYFADTLGVWIDTWRFDAASGRASWRTRLLQPNDAMGRPDGAAVDSADCYWSAGPSASRVNRFSPGGDLLDFIDMPNFRPTMPCFGGEDLRTLYVTSLVQGLAPELRDAHPLAGTLLATRVDATGLPPYRFLD